MRFTSSPNPLPIHNATTTSTSYLYCGAEIQMGIYPIPRLIYELTDIVQFRSGRTANASNIMYILNASFSIGNGIGHSALGTVCRARCVLCMLINIKIVNS